MLAYSARVSRRTFATWPDPRLAYGATKSLYGRDPDGNEFALMWMVPRELWGEDEHRATIAPLDLDREVARFGRQAEASPTA